VVKLPCRLETSGKLLLFTNPRGPAAKLRTFAIVAIVLMGGMGDAGAADRRPFSVADDIELTLIGDPFRGESDAVHWSPNGQYVAAYSERGLISVNRPESALRIYRAQDIEKFLSGRNPLEPPAPIWEIIRSTSTEGPVIAHWRWLADSSGIAFLERGAHQSHRLALADLQSKSLEQLTPADEDVRAYDIRDAKHYAYAVADSGVQRMAAAERNAIMVDVTGRFLDNVLFPPDEHPEMVSWADRSVLWAVFDGRRFEVRDKSTAMSIVLFSEGQRQLALSPDGDSLITVLPVADVPASWEALSPDRSRQPSVVVHAGSQDLRTYYGESLVGRYVRIHLVDGDVEALLIGPTSDVAGWISDGLVVWSTDGRAVLLPGGFVSSAPGQRARPCVAVVTLTPRAASCVEPVTLVSWTGDEVRNTYVDGVGFVGAGSRQVFVHHIYTAFSEDTVLYVSQAGVDWTQVSSHYTLLPRSPNNVDVSVRQGLNEPPVLVATNRKTQVSQVLWDPNPQLKEIELGNASEFRWQDAEGRSFRGGLFLPVPYEKGHRYPLVVQTHGFRETEFIPSGIYPTAFAARALAAAGIAVLQAQDCVVQASDEVPCNVRGYEAAVSALVAQGLVDSQRVGIIGFSRTCWYVMEALTTAALHIRAASVTDGVMGDYWQYLLTVDMNPEGSNTEASEFDSGMGARPFGDGLKTWLARSPLFNIDKVTAPLLIVGEGPRSLHDMWVRMPRFAICTSPSTPSCLTRTSMSSPIPRCA
jgi:dipeptidyl aminopeptidase/acylaminoacyl peptidase